MTFHYGHGTKDRSLGVVDVLCVMAGKPIQITMHVVPGKVPCQLSNGRVKENGAIIDTQTVWLKLKRSDITTSLVEGQSGHHEMDLLDEMPIFCKGRTVALRPRVHNNLPVTPSRIPAWWGHKT